MKKYLLLIAGFCLLAPGMLPALVVRPAANIQWLDANGKLKGLAAFKGKPVVVVVARSPRDWAFRSQVGQLNKMYERLAANKVIFIVAFTGEQGRIGSNIPFVLAPDGPRVAYDYQMGEKFGIAIVGRDGNLDYVTNKVLPVQRIYDIVGASFVTQEMIRRP
jgi:hypothetical protein